MLRRQERVEHPMRAALMGEALALLDHTTQRAPCGTSYLVLDRSYLYGKTQLARSSGVMVPAGGPTSPAPSEVHARRSRAPAFFTTTTGCAHSRRFERTVGTRGEGERTVEGGRACQAPRAVPERAVSLRGHRLAFPVRSRFDRAAEWTSHRAVRSPPSAEPAQCGTIALCIGSR